MTSTAEDWEAENFYQEIDQVLKLKSTYTLVMGNFKANIGRKKLKKNLWVVWNWNEA